MKEIQQILKAYDSWQKAGHALALATVIEVQQSSYRRPGARMLISEDGKWTGGISGGCLEGDTLKKAKLAIHTGEPAIITYDTRDGDPSQIGIGLGCNGLIRVLVTPLAGPSPSAISALIEASATSVPSLLITDLETGTVSHHRTSSYDGPYKEQAQAVLISKKSLLATSTSGRAFVEYLPPAIHLYIFGSNYDVIPMVQVAKSIGWKVTVVANLTKVSTELHRLAPTLISRKADLPESDLYSAALLMSHDYQTDLQTLVKIKERPWAYIGLLGPKTRKDKLLAEPTVADAVPSDIIYGPMGLDTGATTPEEIAIAVLAEIRSVIAKRDGGHLRDRQLPINVDH